MRFALACLIQRFQSAGFQPGGLYRSGHFSMAKRGVPAISFCSGRDLANAREWPNWSDDSEFRAERDKTAAERR